MSSLQQSALKSKLKNSKNERLREAHVNSQKVNICYTCAYIFWHLCMLHILRLKLSTNQQLEIIGPNFPRHTMAHIFNANYEKKLLTSMSVFIIILLF